MIGMIVTGHGQFASGLTSSVKLLAGMPEKFCAVDYLQEDTADDLEEKLEDAVESLKECSGILILADLAGGTPFRTAADLMVENNGIPMRLIAGVNLGMLIQANMARGYVESLDDLSEMAVDEGRKQITLLEKEVIEEGRRERG